MTDDVGQETQMPRASRPPLRGEETLLGAWRELAAESCGAHLVYTRNSFAAVFPTWAPLNNAILLDPPDMETASAASADLADVYTGAGVTSWAMWVPSPTRDLNRPDSLTQVAGMARDTTTLMMTLDLSDGMPAYPRVFPTTVEVASSAGDMSLPVDAVAEHDYSSGVDGWVLVEDGLAVAGAWSYRDGQDVGLYAVGTAPEWRRRGLARALMLHVLADAYRQGARTASLQSTVMGEPLYRSLGFVPVGRYEEWVPIPTNEAALIAAALAWPTEDLRCTPC